MTRRHAHRAAVLATLAALTLAACGSEDPFDELAPAVWRMAPAGTAILRAAPGAQGWGSLLEGRSERAVYVCRGTVCFDPVDDYNELRPPLWRRA